MKTHKKGFMRSNLILPPYLVPYKDAMYQDHFDRNYIRWEEQRFRPHMVTNKPMLVTPVRRPSAIEYIHIDSKTIAMTTDADKIEKDKVDEQAFHTVDDGWFDDW
jgi:hypothetical protein